MNVSRDKARLLVVDALSHFGGAHQVMSRTLPRLAGEFDISVVDVHGNGRYRQLLEQRGLCCTDLGLATDRPYIGGKGSWRRPFLVAKSIPRLLRVRYRLAQHIAEFKPSIVYTNQQPMLRLLATLPQTWTRPVVWHCHGMRHRSQVGFAASQWLGRRRSTSAVIAVSEATATELRHRISPELVHVCHNGICAQEVTQAAATGPRAPLPSTQTEEVVFLMPATIQHGKGQHLAINGLASVRREGEPATLWLAGDVSRGGDNAYLEQLKELAAKLGVARWVHFLGWRDDIWAVMQAADVVMLASLEEESFGLALAEAMALGKPCVGPRVGGVPEVIADAMTGLLFEPRRSDSIALAMLRVTREASFRASCGAAGQRRIEKLFTIDRQVTRMAQVLAKLVSGDDESVAEQVT